MFVIVLAVLAVICIHAVAPCRKKSDPDVIRVPIFKQMDRNPERHNGYAVKKTRPGE